MESFSKLLVLTLWLLSQCLGFTHSDLPNVTGKVAATLLALDRLQIGNSAYDGGTIPAKECKFLAPTTTAISNRSNEKNLPTLAYDAAPALIFLSKDGFLAAKEADAAAALRSKLSALENAQQTAARTRTLPDGRVRYYGAETPARTPGPTRGASYVTEHNPSTGQVRSWMESYDQAGNVTRVHPKMVDGQPG